MSESNQAGEVCLSDVIRKLSGIIQECGDLPVIASGQFVTDLDGIDAAIWSQEDCEKVGGKLRDCVFIDLGK